jgi:hypothetical protein
MARTDSQKVVVDADAWFNEEGDFGSDRTNVLLEQYKLYVESSNGVSDRRGAANTFLLTANTALVTIYGFAASDHGPAQGPWRWLLPLAGLFVCIAWFGVLSGYRELNLGKFAVINEIEKRLAGRLFDLEWQYTSASTRFHIPLTPMEQAIPVVFAGVYVVLLVAVGWRP